LLDVAEDYKHPVIVHKSTGVPIELDVYIEALRLAFEYQGEQHYMSVYWAGALDLAARKKKDQEKQVACKEVKHPFAHNK